MDLGHDQRKDARAQSRKNAMTGRSPVECKEPPEWVKQQAQLNCARSVGAERKALRSASCGDARILWTSARRRLASLESIDALDAFAAGDEFAAESPRFAKFEAKIESGNFAHGPANPPSMVGGFPKSADA